MAQRYTLLCACALMFACDDGAANDPAPGADASINVDSSVDPDAADRPDPDAGEDPDPDAATVEPDAALPGDLSPGAACDCDDQCNDVDGQDGICILGVCMVAPDADCGGGEVEGCPDGFQCWNLSGGAGPYCWPDCDLIGADSCAGTCDGDGSCAPTADNACTAECSTYCGGDVTTGDIGGPCAGDGDCGGATCYLAEGWVEGYCLDFGCAEPGAECGTGGVCVSGLADDPVCMGVCAGADDCRPGYQCNDAPDGSICMAGCDADADCPDGTVCAAEICVPDFRCSPARPAAGDCPAGQVCTAGECVAFACDAEGPLEPNDDQASAAAVEGAVEGLQICAAEADWFRFTPSAADTMYTVGHTAEFGSGNLDVLLKNADGSVREQAWLLPDGYHPENPRGPMNLEALSLVGHPDAAAYDLHVFGVAGAVNEYDLHWQATPYRDGPDCEGAGFTRQQCRGLTPQGRLAPQEYIPFPAGHPADPYIGDGVFFASGLSQSNNPGYVPSSARWARREMVMAIRHAIHTVQTAYPETGPLGVGEISMRDGTTPNGHPNGTHYYGANVDMAYYIKPENQRTWGNIVYRPICSDKANLRDWSDVDTDGSTGNYGECVPGSEDTHIVDIPRTALFFASMCATGRVRVFGVDTSIAAALKTEYRRLWDEEIITQKAYSTCMNAQASADDDGSWVWHFNHSHVSFCAESCPGEKASLTERLRPQYDWGARLSRDLEPSLEYTSGVIPREVPPR